MYNREVHLEILFKLLKLKQVDTASLYGKAGYYGNVDLFDHLNKTHNWIDYIEAITEGIIHSGNGTLLYLIEPLVLNGTVNFWKHTDTILYGDNIKLLNLYLEKYTGLRLDWNKALKSKNIEMIKLGLSKGATELNEGLYYQIQKGNTMAIEFLLSIINIKTIDWDKVIFNAGVHNISHLIDLGVKNGGSLSIALENAAKYGHIKLVEQCLQQIEISEHSPKIIIQQTVFHGHFDIVRLLRWRISVEIIIKGIPIDVYMRDREIQPDESNIYSLTSDVNL
jgi:hypothetical protein